MTYTIGTKVASGLSGARLQSITSAITNEVENIPPVYTYITLTSSGSGTGTGTGSNLSQTGPMSTLLVSILTALAYLGYKTFQRRKRYI